MLANFDYYNRFEPSIISLCYPNNRFISVMDNVKNLRISSEFNAVSELSCDIYKIGLDGIKTSAYEKIAVKMQLFLEDVGYFIITDCNEIDDENGIYKSLSLLSCEHELTYKKINYFNGTYKFWDSNPSNLSLLGTIMSSLPRWTVKYVDKNVENLYRTFEEPDSTIYSFLMDDVEDAYECIFEFDIINREISVYDKNNFVNKTTILLSKKDIIDSIKVETKSEEIFTALTLYGDDEITYSGINPLGTSTVYNFNYYKEWMSDELQAALNTWESNITNAEASISTLRTSLSNKYTELQTIQGKIDSINEQIILLEKQLGVNTLDATMVSNLTAQINTKKSELATQQTAYDSKADEISAINQQLDEIYASCSFESSFTEEQVQELDAYIYGGSDVDDTFAFTDDMSYEEQEQILVGLYNKAKSMLSDISVPTEELSLDTNNFIFQKEFLPYTEQLNTGVIVDIEIKDDVIVSYVLLKMEVNYQDKTINLTFGNKYRSSAAEKLWSDWEGKVSKTSTTLTYERSKYGKAVDSGSLDKMNAFMKSSLDLTLNQIKSSDGQSYETTDSGTKFRRIDPETGEVDSRQMWQTSNNIVFTDDNWNTIKTAIGRLILPDGTEGYGINAEYILGKMIMANGMEITNEGGTFVIDEDGVSIDNYDIKIAALEKQIGGETKFYETNEPPTFENYPANTWYSDIHYPPDSDATAEYTKYLGSFIYDSSHNVLYRFILNDLNEFDFEIVEESTTGYILQNLNNLKIESNLLSSELSTQRVIVEDNQLKIIEQGTKIEQTDEYIKNEVVKNGEVISSINQSQEGISIQADKINLEGTVTANENFKILKDGSIEANSGKIGGWQIGDKLYSSNPNVFINPGYKEWDMIGKYVKGTGTLTAAQKTASDFNRDGVVNLADSLICRKLVEGDWTIADVTSRYGYIPKQSTIKVTINPSLPSKAIRITGTNAWGRAIDYYLGVDGINSNKLVSDAITGGFVRTSAGTDLDELNSNLLKHNLLLTNSAASQWSGPFGLADTTIIEIAVLNSSNFVVASQVISVVVAKQSSSTSPYRIYSGSTLTVQFYINSSNHLYLFNYAGYKSKVYC